MPLVYETVGIWKKESRLVLSLGFFMGWMLTVPLFGPALYSVASGRGINPETLINVFLFSHALGLFLAGETRRFAPRTPRWRPAVCACLIFTVSLLFLQGTPLLLAGALAGLAGGFYNVGWGAAFASRILPHERGKVLAGAVILVNLLLYVIGLLSPVLAYPWMVLLVSLPLLALLWPDAEREVTPFSPAIKSSPTTSPSLSFLLILASAIMVLYLGGGLMYRVINPLLSGSTPLALWLGPLPYILVVAVAGPLADLNGRRPLLNWSLAFLGFSFLLVPLVPDASIRYLASQLPMQAGYAFADLYLWTTLADITPAHLSSRYYGRGLALNVAAIGGGSLIGLRLIQHVDYPVYVALVAGLMFFGASAFIWRLAETHPGLLQPSGRHISASSDLAAATMAEAAPSIHALQSSRMPAPDCVTAWGLTRREAEILELMLQGCDNSFMMSALNISSNTLKTHLRHIYRKVGVTDRSGLLLAALNGQNG